MKKRPNENAPEPLTLSERLAALEEPGLFEEMPHEENGDGFVFVGGVVEALYASTTPTTVGNAASAFKKGQSDQNS